MLVSACGGGASAPTTLAVEATGSGKESKVKAPGSIEGGLVEFEFKNSTKQPQDAQLIRTEGNHSVGEVLKIVGGQEGGPIPDWLQDGGGVGETPPGKTHSATQNLAAGKYYLVASSEEGKPATAAIEVKGGSEGELPKTSASITAREYTFETSGLKSGRNEVLFRNAGQQLHHVVGLPLLPGKTLDEVKKFVGETGQGGRPSGPPPFDEKGGFSTTVLDGGVEQVTDLDLKPGRYALICFIQDRTGGPPHVMKGMVTEVDVK